MLKAHIILTVIWGILVIPTILWWKDSILWVGFMSIYAILELHVIGIVTALTKKEVKENE